MAKKKKAQECALGAPLWMATFADMVTLLLAFFVMLLSMSSIQESKFNEAVYSLQGAFGVMQSPPTVIQQQTVVIPTPRENEVQEILYEFTEIKVQLEEEGLADEVELSMEKDGIAMRVSSPFLFELARAELRPESASLLGRLGRSLVKMGKTVRVEGHTDNIPISSAEFPSNWELSTARAVAVLRALEGAGVDAKKLSAIGYGEYSPVVPNADTNARQKNRRVEIFVEYESQERVLSDAQNRQEAPSGRE